MCHCANCGADIEFYCPIDEKGGNDERAESDAH